MGIVMQWKIVVYCGEVWCRFGQFVLFIAVNCDVGWGSVVQCDTVCEL